MKIGYARVSTGEQSVEAQVDALKAAGCEKIFREVASGAKNDRPVLKQALDYLRSGEDTLVTYKLDRVARSLPHLIEIMEHLKSRDVGFQSLTEEINTNSAGGKLLFHIMGAIAEFERDLIRERTNAGLQAARKAGRVGGRPRVMDDHKIIAARSLLDQGTPVKDVAMAIGVSVPTLYRWLPGSTR
ncbi:recombinase family protein [Halocynthiibacter styelae]|uniref:Recombinase family protein n=1 Tax=Halocynthiibacter styelae TaxID=2761955 RepID=A0A8J7LNY1_9RHOB|nr:recombinase family protein [Paenihalocynthiibacter styelae]MBI1492032.1 recombinase family protein [Paenihalocynthiibacter styelae]